MNTRPLDITTLEAAANWYVNLRSEAHNESLHNAHRHWLASDPSHARAWERLSRLQDKLERVAPGVTGNTLQSARAKRRDVLKVLSLLLAAGASGVFGWRATPLPEWVADQRTGTGERSRIQLEDGSQLQLNTATSVNINYSEDLREVHLLQGEMLIETVRDARQRPFIVHTAEGSLRALGTRFIVQHQGGSTFLSVLEHAVEVRSANLPLTPLRVAAGQRLSFTAETLGKLSAVDPQADAWTRDMLVVSDWRLGEFIAELQRYRPGYLGCESRVADLRLSGAFHLGDTDQVLHNLSSTLPVRVRQLSRYWTRIEAV